MTDRQKLKYYLKAMRNFLEQQEESCYVLDVLSMCIEEEEVNPETDFFGDGGCLLEEIREELEELDEE